MTPDLDLEIRAWTKTRGDVTAIGTWVRLDGQFKPCMALIPAGREKSDRLRPCVITQDRAWIWSEDVGDPEQTARIVFKYAEVLGLSMEPRTIIWLASFIHDMLGDLLHIPPYQPQDRISIAEAVLIDNQTGKIVGETEITEH
jgi:hypothetical protein